MFKILFKELNKIFFKILSAYFFMDYESVDMYAKTWERDCKRVTFGGSAFAKPGAVEPEISTLH